METRVIVTEHARQRSRERGDVPAAVINENAAKILAASVRAQTRRIALTSNEFPVIPIVEVSPRRQYIGLVIVTVLPQGSSIPHPIVHSR
jgi:hypothetical protein